MTTARHAPIVAQLASRNFRRFSRLVAPSPTVHTPTPAKMSMPASTTAAEIAIATIKLDGDDMRSKQTDRIHAPQFYHSLCVPKEGA